MIKKNRAFGLVVGGVLIVYTALQYFLKDKCSLILVGLGLCLLVLAWLKPLWLTPLQLLWDKVGFIMGIINTHVLLTAFYYLLLTPVAILRRVVVNPIKRQPGNTGDTYWQTHSVDDDNQFKNQY